MGHEIINGIYLTPDDRVIVRHAAGNVEPRIFRDEEYEFLTEVMRTEGRQRLDEEILYLFFRRVWQGTSRYARMAEWAIARMQPTIHAVYERCRRDESFRRRFLQQLSGCLGN